jgi:1-acyl-sn-glycerol-3-phosphate acyltransferase
MRAGAPVVPIAVVGAEESMPTLTTIPALARLLGLPYFPVTANMLLFGPAGLFVYLPAKFKLRVLDPVHFDVPPDQPRYPRSRVMEEAESIRKTIQDELYEMLSRRQSIWRG